MKISTKLSLLVFCVIIPIMGFFYFINASLVLRQAKNYEKNLIEKQGLRLKEQLSKQFEIVGASGQDWGAWDDTYAFIQGKRPSFLKENLLEPVVALGALRSDFVAFYKKDGSLVYSIGADFDKKISLAIPHNVLKEFELITKDFFSKIGRDKKKVQGYYLNDKKALLFSGHIIIHSDYTGAPEGLLFLGRFLDQRFVKSLGELLQGEIKFINLYESQNITKFQKKIDTLKTDIILLEWGEQDINLYFQEKDHRGESSLLIHATQDRNMNLMIVQVLKNEAYLWASIAFFIIVLLFLGNHFFVLKRIQSFLKVFNQIKGGFDLGLRINDTKNDEIAMLAQGFNHMMSSLQEKQQDLLHSSKMASVGILTSGVAHEINNPLFIAKGYIQILQKKIKKDSNLIPYQELMMQIENALIRIEEIIHTLQQYTKVNDLKTEIIRFNHVLEDVLVISKSKILKDEINLVSEIPKENIEIKGSFNAVQQVVTNLIANAIEALEAVPKEQRHLNISLSCEEENAVLIIRDSGAGIPEQNMLKIFDPFFTTKEVGRGIGLGLFTVHSFVKSLGGKISCGSEVGKGTTFKVIVPKHQFEVKL